MVFRVGGTILKPFLVMATINTIGWAFVGLQTSKALAKTFLEPLSGAKSVVKRNFFHFPSIYMRQWQKGRMQQDNDWSKLNSGWLASSSTLS